MLKSLFFEKIKFKKFLDRVCPTMHYDGSFEPKLRFFDNIVHLYLFFNYSIYLHNQQQHASKPKYE